MENSSIAARLKSIIQYLGLSDSQFADQCDISRATLSLLLSGKNKKISDVLLSQIHEAFPSISIIWLLFNEGDMVENHSNDSEDIVSRDSSNENFADFLGDNSEIRADDKNDDKYSNLMPLNQLENTIKLTVLKAFESFLKNEDLTVNKIIKDENKRKVRQVTVYYDDSTFETFVPAEG